MVEKDFETIEVNLDSIFFPEKCDGCKRESKKLVTTMARPDQKVCEECLPNQIPIE